MFATLNNGTMATPLIVALREVVTIMPTTPALLARILTLANPMTMTIVATNGLRES